MTKLIVIDAGPTLNFLSAGHKDLLLAAVEAIEGELRMPEEVEVEVLEKAGQRSAAVGRSLRRQEESFEALCRLTSSQSWSHLRMTLI
ncbi:hypothetical protein [Salinibacterium sp.]|uniref:hypothetical protein n=1 Tax=Salinibacterium sp. TaxID=1915057 RepID=UPI00286A6AFE|nr:hypothetical protein [Salinibacterium sp.]